MWEVYTGVVGGPYGTMPAASVMARVASGALRPRFPAAAPREYAALAAQCWAHEPAARPEFAEIVARLNALQGAVLAAAVAHETTPSGGP